MAWQMITYSCGHEGRVQLYGPYKTREWRAERLAEGLCDECLNAQREEESEFAAASNKEMGLPALKGSPKQIAWAETIRHYKIAYFDDEIERESHYEIAHDMSPRDLGAAMERIMAETSAEWWINRRGGSAEDLLTAAHKTLSKAAAQTPSTSNIEVELIAEATVRPEEAKTETVAEIVVEDGVITICFPERREDFRLRARSLGYSWTGSVWKRTPGPLAGDVTHRAAEAMVAILDLGYIARTFHEDVRRMAVERSFEPEQKKWVFATPGKAEFSIRWGRDDDLYKEVRSLKGSSWDSRRQVVTVPAVQYEEVLDFAEVHGFSVSKEARKIVEGMERVRDESLVAPPAPPKEEAPAIDELAIPEEGFEVDPSLIDTEMNRVLRPRFRILECEEEVPIDETLRDDD